MRNRIEAAIQRELVKWIPVYLIEINFPFEVKLAATQNENSRHAVDMGMDVGEPDTRISYRRNAIYRIMYLELKKKDGYLLPSQIDWNADFDLNYVTQDCIRAVAYGFEEAKEKIITFLSA